MAFSRIQATPVVKANTSSLTLTFPTAPTVGNAIIVIGNQWSQRVPQSCTDSRGHTYDLITSATNGCSSWIFAIPRILNSADPYSITITGDSTYYIALAFEVKGDSAIGLYTDQYVALTGSSNRPTTGITAALRAANGFAIAAHSINQNHTSIVVDASIPAWTQEHEELTTSYCPGEINTRIIGPNAAGTTQSCTWTDSGSATNWASCLAVFVRAEDLPPTHPRVSQDAIEVLNQPQVEASVTQTSVEVLHQPKADARASQNIVEILSQPSAPARVSQAPVEVLHLPKPEVFVTQNIIEVLSQPKPPIRVSQVVVEAAVKPVPPAGITQFLTETLVHPHPSARVGQVVVETLWYQTFTKSRVSQIVAEVLVKQERAVGTGAYNTPFMGAGGNPWIE